MDLWVGRIEFDFLAYRFGTRRGYQPRWISLWQHCSSGAQADDDRARTPQFCRPGKKTQARGCEYFDDPDYQATRRPERFWAERSVWRSFPSRTIKAEESRVWLHHRARWPDPNKLSCSG